MKNLLTETGHGVLALLVSALGLGTVAVSSGVLPPTSKAGLAVLAAGLIYQAATGKAISIGSGATVAAPVAPVVAAPAPAVAAPAATPSV